MFSFNKSKLYITPVILTAMLGGSMMAKASSPTTQVQDTQKAVEFFDQELAFKTNPHGTQYVVNGTVKNVTIVDVRAAKDFAKGHIPGAINLPYDQYSNFEGKETEFMGLRKDGYNYIYCYELLCNLGQKAAKKFASVGYPVKEMVGGFKSWQEGGFPVEK